LPDAQAYQALTQNCGENMKIKTTMAVSAVALIAACGGSSTGGTDNEILWKAQAPSTVGVVRAKGEGNNGVALVQNVNSAGAYQSVEVVRVISETRNSDGSTTGEVVVRWADGSTSNVTGIIYDSAALYANYNDTSLSIAATGTQATNLPVGNYTFAGYAGSLYAYNGSIYLEDGNFVMNVDFGSRTAQLTANMTESQYINPNLKFNSSGEISGSNGEFIVYDTDGVTELERRTISFNGTFHGSNARSVSGIAAGESPSGERAFVGIVGDR